MKRKAALRLAELVDPAIATLGQLLVRAESETVRLRAVVEVLDRTGYSKSVMVTTEQEAMDRLLELLLEAIDEEEAAEAEGAET